MKKPRSIIPTDIVTADINAAARIIGDISTGIYRSPANALKELVSNSFDAGATEVLINTDPPSFSAITCYDNGPGISTEELQKILGYIGGSNKRLEKDVGTYGRPIIGKLGIGILAMSQMSKQFIIISSQKGKNYRIEVEIDIEQFESSEASKTNLGKGKIGRYTIHHIPEKSQEHYTIITTPAGNRRLREELGSDKSAREHFVNRSYKADNFYDFVKNIHEQKRRPTLNRYDTFLWELASLCPVQYFEDGPVQDWDGWDQIKKRLQSYRFTVVVDGYELRKPILLPTMGDLRTFGEDYAVYSFEVNDQKTPDVRAVGYVYHQRLQISPKQLQGVLLRLRNVGIRGYEGDLLSYPRNLGPMMGGMTSEIYIDKGLEDALNIDRNSFNETHPHFLAIRNALFEHLGTPEKRGITADIRKRSKHRQDLVHKDQTLDDIDRLLKRLNRFTCQNWTLKLDSSQDSPISVDLAENAIVINVDHDTVPVNRSKRKEFFRVCLIARLLETMGPPKGIDDALVGWLRKL